MTQYKVVSKENVTLVTAAGEHLSAHEAEDAVRTALRICGYEGWGEMRIDMFEGSGGGLLIACPGECGAVHIRSELLPFLQEYFTD